jgi:microcystin-dependent protein
LSPTPANTATGTYTNYIGSIYANEHKLEVTYNDYGNGVTNTMRLTTMVTTTQVTNISTDLCSAQFVHSILPYGSITMWYGTVETIPAGWALCNGTNDTPNLVDRFIVGAGFDYVFAGNSNFQAATNIMGTASAIGGSSSTVLVSHTHVTTAGEAKFDISHDGLINDPGHHHIVPSLVQDDADNNGANGTQYGAVEPNGRRTSTATTNITLDPHKDVTIPGGPVAIESAGTSTYSHTNIPPFHALCYIMKITGFGITGTL